MNPTIYLNSNSSDYNQIHRMLTELSNLQPIYLPDRPQGGPAPFSPNQNQPFQNVKLTEMVADALGKGQAFRMNSNEELIGLIKAVRRGKKEALRLRRTLNELENEYHSINLGDPFRQQKLSEEYNRKINQRLLKAEKSFRSQLKKIEIAKRHSEEVLLKMQSDREVAMRRYELEEQLELQQLDDEDRVKLNEDLEALKKNFEQKFKLMEEQQANLALLGEEKVFKNRKLQRQLQEATMELDEMMNELNERLTFEITRIRNRDFKREEASFQTTLMLLKEEVEAAESRIELARSNRTMFETQQAKELAEFEERTRQSITREVRMEDLERNLKRDQQIRQIELQIAELVDERRKVEESGVHQEQIFARELERQKSRVFQEHNDHMEVLKEQLNKILEENSRLQAEASEREIKERELEAQYDQFRMQSFHEIMMKIQNSDYATLRADLLGRMEALDREIEDIERRKVTLDLPTSQKVDEALLRKLQLERDLAKATRLLEDIKTIELCSDREHLIRMKERYLAEPSISDESENSNLIRQRFKSKDQGINERSELFLPKVPKLMGDIGSIGGTEAKVRTNIEQLMGINETIISNSRAFANDMQLEEIPGQDSSIEGLAKRIEKELAEIESS